MERSLVSGAPAQPVKPHPHPLMELNEWKVKGRFRESGLQAGEPGYKEEKTRNDDWLIELAVIRIDATERITASGTARAKKEAKAVAARALMSILDP